MLASLADAFQSNHSRVLRAIAIVHMVDGTTMKQRGPEAQWLPTYGWFFDLLNQLLLTHNGNIVKYIENGALAAFDIDSTTDAVNWSIRVQEEVLRAQDEGRVLCDCSIGISCGQVVSFQTPFGTIDYIGEVVDRAYLLCRAANAKAIFIDEDVVTSASMHLVHSQIGSLAPRRQAKEYLGDIQSVKGEGFHKPLDYREILWGRSRYGVSGPFVSDLSKRQSPPSSERSSDERTTRATSGERIYWAKGKVKTLYADRGYGFIEGANGEDFWYNSACLFDERQAPREGDPVFFIPKDPLPNAKSRRALDVIGLGAILRGKLDKIFSAGFGFASCTNAHGEERQLFINLGVASKWTFGDAIEFTVGENKKGIAGDDPKII